MFERLTTFFSFLHRNTRSFLLNHNPITRRRRPNTSLFSSNSSINDSLSTNMGVSNQFKQVFKLIDTNGDGKISAAELSKVLLRLGHATTTKKKKNKSSAAEEAEGMVRVLDFNGDGFLDLEEFMEAVMDGVGAKKNGSHDDDDELKDAFLIFDGDENGVIDAKELQRVMVNLGCDNCSLGECERMIQGVDKNGDGLVDFEEFRSMMTSTAS